MLETVSALPGDTALLAGLAIGVACGLLAGGILLIARGRIQEGRSEELLRDLATAQAGAKESADLKDELSRTRESLSRLQAEHAASRAAMRERELAMEAKLGDFTKIKSEMTRDFEALAAGVLKSNQEGFLTLAKQTFEKHHSGAKADLSTLIKPMQDTLKRYEAGLQAIEQERQKAYGALSAELKNVAAAQAEVHGEAKRLVNALRAAPKTRGRWGEHQLQNIMELSGMAEHVDFKTQVGMSGEDGRLVPDAIIRLPGERALVVDAKTSMSAYLDALEATDDEERERLLKLHAAQIRNHMRQLGSKKYWDSLEVAPDFVVMFIPGDNFYAAATERDPDLFESAMSARVMIMTPSTMVALLRAIAYGWRQEQLAENAREVADLGRELYRRLSKMGSHITRTGKSLETAVRGFNQMVGSLEAQVMPQARRFKELEVAGANEELPALEPVDLEPREPSKGRDLEFDADDRPRVVSMDKVQPN